MLVLESMDAKRPNSSQPRPNSSHHCFGDEVLFVSVFIHTSGIQVTAKKSFIILHIHAM
jgi:hypothetical protein